MAILMNVVLKMLTRNSLKHVFKKLQTRSAKSIEANGDYFENEHMEILFFKAFREK